MRRATHFVIVLVAFFVCTLGVLASGAAWARTAPASADDTPSIAPSAEDLMLAGSTLTEPIPSQIIKIMDYLRRVKLDERKANPRFADARACRDACASLARRVNDRRKDVDSLKRLVDAAKKRADELEAQLATMKTRLDALALAADSNKRSETDRVNARIRIIDRMKVLITNIATRDPSKRDITAKMSELLDAIRARLQRRLAELGASPALEDLRSRIRQKEKELDDARSRLRMLINDYSAALKSLEASRADLKTRRERCDEVSARAKSVVEYYKRVLRLIREIRDGNADIRNGRTERLSDDLKKEGWNALIRKIGELLRLLRGSSDRLKDPKERCKTDLAAVRTRIKRKEDEETNLNGRLRTLKSRIPRLRARLSALLRRIRSMRGRLRCTTSQCTALNLTMNTDAVTRLGSLKRAVDVVRGLARDGKMPADSSALLTSLLTSVAGSLRASAKRALERSSTRYGSCKRSERDLLNKIALLRDRANALQSLLDNARARASSLELRLVIVRRQKDVLVRRAADLAKRCDARIAFYDRYLSSMRKDVRLTIISLGLERRYQRRKEAADQVRQRQQQAPQRSSRP